jgi:3(or 17)beta-hydroxysteroid dehydrogenase
MSDRLKNKVALITGGACGIGLSHAELFAEEGAKVVITTRKKIKEGESLAQSLRDKGYDAIFLPLDVADEAMWQAVISKTIATYGKLNIIINNAGISQAKKFEETSLEDWNAIMATNATGVFLGIKQGMLAMKNNGEPCSIVNISSIDAMIGEADLAPYCASKGAVRTLTKATALACTQAGYSIRVNSVHPGYIRTELSEKEAEDFGITPEQYFEKVGKLHPMGHIGDPIDVAYQSLYLASDESKWVTGTEMVVDGGYLMQ